MQIELFLDKDKKWRLRIRAENGRIICSSEAYSSKRTCMDTARTLLASKLVMK